MTRDQLMLAFHFNYGYQKRALSEMFHISQPRVAQIISRKHLYSVDRIQAMKDNSENEGIKEKIIAIV